MEKEITIYDIADSLNISGATVSRALNNHPKVSIKTKKKVLETAERLGYRQNMYATNLRKQSTKTIGVILHELKSNFITSVLAGIEKITTENGYDIIIGHSSESYEKEMQNVQNFYHKRVDGLLCSLAFDTKNLEHYNPFIEKNIPIVFFDRVVENSDTNQVIIDNFKSGYDATKHLIEQGCTNLAIITSNLSRNVYSQRLEGFKKALSENNLPFLKNNLITTDLSVDAAKEAALNLIKHKKLPDGIFITHDFSAAVVIKTLKDRGIKIPEEVKIIGFNNDPVSRIIEPTLTTINYPGFQIGEVAASSLINKINGKFTETNNKIIIGTNLIVRDSTVK